MAKAWFCILGALIALVVIGPRPGFDPTLPVVGILAVAFIMMLRVVFPPLPAADRRAREEPGTYLGTGGGFDVGSSFGACDVGSSGGDCGSAE